MVDLSGVQQMVQKVTEKAAEQQQNSGDAANAREGDAEAFRNAMNSGQGQSGSEGAQATQQTEAPEHPKSVNASEETSVGSKILDNLQSTNERFTEVMAQAEKALGGQAGDLSAKEMMQLQMKLQQVQLQQELLGKTASKSTQNIDTLLKGQ